MGGVCSAREAIMAGQYDMPGLSAEEIESVFQDIQGAPNFIPNLIKVEWLRGSTKGNVRKVGSSWFETRQWRGKHVVMRKSVTQISRNPHYTLSSTGTNAEFRPNFWTCTPNFVNTYTIVIEPTIGTNTGCVVKWTMAALSTNLISHIMSKISHPKFEKDMTQTIQEEMQSFYLEGIRRRQQQKEQPLEEKKRTDVGVFYKNTTNDHNNKNNNNNQLS